MGRPSATGSPAASDATAPGVARPEGWTGRKIGTLVLQGLSIAGAGFAITAIGMLFREGFGAGVDLQAYMRAGDAIRSGGPVYTTGVAEGLAFLYSPVWAVLFAAISWLPGWLLQAAIMALDLAALRYAIGSWIGVGLFAWYPMVWFEFSSGNIDILIAAAIVMAWRHTAAPLALVAFAKVSPVLALDPKRLREFVVVAIVLLAITIPWGGLWIEYAQFLARQPSVQGTVIAIPWYVRLPFAVLLLVPRRPWTSALAAIVAVPTWYWYTTVILIAPIRLFVDDWRRRREGRTLEGTGKDPGDRAVGAV